VRILYSAAWHAYLVYNIKYVINQISIIGFTGREWTLQSRVFSSSEYYVRIRNAIIINNIIMQYCCVIRSVHVQRRINRRHSPGKEIIRVTNRVGHRVTRIVAECSIG